jgi:hypothetical protein
MRTLLTTVLSAGLLTLAGCESMPTELRSRLEHAPKVTRVFAIDAEEVFYACQAALRRIEFTLSRTDRARGLVVGHSRMHSGGSFRDSWQFEMDLWISADESGQTKVGALLVEVLESPASGSSRKAMVEHGLYDTFFEALNSELADPGGRK